MPHQKKSHPWSCQARKFKALASVVQPALLDAAATEKTASDMLLWVKKKLGLNESASDSDVYGAMHVWDHRQQGYTKYIESYRCEDKQGEIARLSKEVAELRFQLERAATK